MTSQYVNDNNRIYNCPVGCEICDRKGRCLTAYSPYKLNPYTEIITYGCATTSIVLKSLCIPCQSMCKACNLTDRHCSTCPPSTYLDPISQVCSPCNRPGVYVTSSNTCANCSASCLACSIVPNNCTSCRHPERPLADATGLFSCVLNANSSHMVLESNQTFLKCQDPCKTCHGSIVTCGECINSWFKKEADLLCSQCTETGRFLSGKMCLDCDPSCLTC